MWNFIGLFAQIYEIRWWIKRQHFIWKCSFNRVGNSQKVGPWYNYSSSFKRRFSKYQSKKQFWILISYIVRKKDKMFWCFFKFISFSFWEIYVITKLLQFTFNLNNEQLSSWIVHKMHWKIQSRSTSRH